MHVRSLPDMLAGCNTYKESAGGMLWGILNELHFAAASTSVDAAITTAMTAVMLPPLPPSQRCEGTYVDVP